MDFESIISSEVPHSQKKLHVFLHTGICAVMYACVSVNRRVCGHSINEERTGSAITWW